MATTISGSGIDVQGMVAQLMQIERQPLSQIQTQRSQIDTKISAIGKVKSALAAFQDAAKALRATETYAARKTTSANADAVSATATSTAVPGKYSVNVTAMASRQSLYSDATWPAATAVADSGGAGGKLYITPKAGATEVAVTIPANATLEQVRDAINGTADVGVKASIVADGTQFRLMLRGDTVGADGAFTVRVDEGADGVDDTDATGLSALAYDPAAAVGAGKNLKVSQAASDAQFTIDGLALKSASNSVAGVIEGVTFELKRTGGPIDVTVSNDNDAIKAKVDDFIGKYNALNSLLNTQTRYDAGSKVAGTLQGDSRFVGLQRQLRSLMAESVAGGTLARLSEAGLQVGTDGSLSLNATKFAAATPEQLTKLFAADGATAADKGIARRLYDLVGGMLGTDGVVGNADSALQSRRRALEKREDALETRLEQVQKRLLQTYSRLDAQLTGMSQRMSQVSNL